MNDTELDQLLDVWQAPAAPPSMRRGLAACLPAPSRRVLGLRPRWLAMGAAACVAALCVAGADQLFGNPEILRFWGAWSNGLYMQTTRLVSPPQAQMHWWMTGSGYSIGGEGALHGTASLRVRQSRFSMTSPRTIYGYRYELQPMAGGEYQISFTAQTGPATSNMGPIRMNDTYSPPPELPAPQTVPMGQPIEVTLYQDAGSRVFDRIVLQWSAFPDWPKAAAGAPPQGTIRLVSPQLTIDGAQVVTGGPNAGSGPVAWLHMPNEGRYLIALNPLGNPRFGKAGELSGNTLEFQSEGHRFRIVCAQPISSGPAGPVYVYHQQSFEKLLDPAHPLTATPFFGNAGPASLHVE